MGHTIIQSGNLGLAVYDGPDTGSQRNMTPEEHMIHRLAAEIERLHFLIAASKEQIEDGDESGAYLILKSALKTGK